MKKFLLVLLTLSFATDNFSQKKTMTIIDTKYMNGGDSACFHTVATNDVNDSLGNYYVTFEISISQRDFDKEYKKITAKGKKIDTATKRNFLTCYSSVEDYELNHANRYFIFSPDIFVRDKGTKRIVLIPLSIKDLRELTEIDLLIAEINLRVYKITNQDELDKKKHSELTNDI
jgi:hypothetical protein